MRLSNYKNIPANKASISITATLYDRRALDCTTDKPLVNSLNNLTFLASSSAKVRETLVADGGLLRLVDILKDCYLEEDENNNMEDDLNFDFDQTSLDADGDISSALLGRAYNDFQTCFLQYLNKLLTDVNNLGNRTKSEFSSSWGTSSRSNNNTDGFISASDELFLPTSASDGGPDLDGPSSLKVFDINDNLVKHFNLFINYLNKYRFKKNFRRKKSLNEKKILVSWKWTLTLQVLVLCGTRGNEKIRRKIVESGIIQIVSTVLDNYLLVKSGKINLNGSNNTETSSSPRTRRSNTSGSTQSTNSANESSEQPTIDSDITLQSYQGSDEGFHELFNEVITSIYNIVSSLNGVSASRENVSVSEIQDQIQQFVQNTNPQNDNSERSGNTNLFVPPQQLQSLGNLLLETLNLLGKASISHSQQTGSSSLSAAGRLRNNESNIHLLRSIRANIRIITLLLRGLTDNMHHINENLSQMQTDASGNANRENGLGVSADEIHELINQTNALNAEIDFNHLSNNTGANLDVTNSRMALVEPESAAAQPGNQFGLDSNNNSALEAGTSGSTSSNITNMAQSISNGLARFGEALSGTELHDVSRAQTGAAAEIPVSRGNETFGAQTELSEHFCTYNASSTVKKFTKALREIIFDDDSNNKHYNTIILNDVRSRDANNNLLYWSVTSMNKEISLGIDTNGKLNIVCDKRGSRRNHLVSDLIAICKEFEKPSCNPNGAIGLERYAGSIFITKTDSRDPNNQASLQDSPYYYKILAHLFKNVFFRDLDGVFRACPELNGIFNSTEQVPQQDFVNEAEDHIVDNAVSNETSDNEALNNVNNIHSDNSANTAENTTTNFVTNFTTNVTNTANATIDNNNNNNDGGVSLEDNEPVVDNETVNRAADVTITADNNDNDAIVDTDNTPAPGAENIANEEAPQNRNNNTNADNANQYFDFILFSPPREFHKGKIIPTDDDIIWVLQLLAFVSKYPHMKDVLQFSYILPKLSLREYPNDTVGKKYSESNYLRDVLANKQHIRASKSDLDVASKQMIENHFKKGWDKEGSEYYLFKEKLNVDLRTMPFFSSKWWYFSFIWLLCSTI